MPIEAHQQRIKMRRESKKMEISGMKINYTTRGSGKSALLLLHGAVGEYWRH